MCAQRCLVAKGKFVILNTRTLFSVGKKVSTCGELCLLGLNIRRLSPNGMLMSEE